MGNSRPIQIAFQIKFIGPLSIRYDRPGSQNFDPVVYCLNSWNFVVMNHNFVTSIDRTTLTIPLLDLFQ